MNELIEAEAKRRAEFMTKEFRRERDEAREEAKNARKDADMMRLVVRGMLSCPERFELRITLSPDMLLKDSTHAVLRQMQANYASVTAAEIEKRLGWPGVHLQEAMMHIGYLEGHAHNRGLPFKPFEWKAPETLLR